jgi:hypothetical protein
MNDDMPAGRRHVGDDEWNDFVQRFAGESASAPAGVTGPVRKRGWPWGVGALVVAVAVAAVLVLRPAASQPGEDVATAAPATAAATPSPAASTAQPASVRAMVTPEEAFPAHVGSGERAFSRVDAATMRSCTEPDAVGQRLIAMIHESAGCLGEETALYKDAHSDQFTLAVFTMRDPMDALKLVTELSTAFDDYEVGTLAPPPGSGLPTLPSGSGRVQGFTGAQRVMVVGLAQWSDGRTGDYQELVNRLQPLLTAVSTNVARYESAR